uniref:Uncharacterized protein n=1 Tax=Trichuris muris TaxID=70415 RepID=A0A5S6Q305_TRIMR
MVSLFNKQAASARQQSRVINRCIVYGPVHVNDCTVMYCKQQAAEYEMVFGKKKPTAARKSEEFKKYVQCLYPCLA